MKCITAIYDGLSCIIFLASFLQAIGFLGNLWVPKTIDAHPALQRRRAECSSKEVLTICGSDRRSSRMVRHAYITRCFGLLGDCANALKETPRLQQNPIAKLTSDCFKVTPA